MRKIKFVLFATIILYLSVAGNVQLNTYALSTELLDESSSSKIYCTATLEDTFADDSVIVVINKQNSKSPVQFAANRFKDISVKTVRSLTASMENEINKNTLSNKIDLQSNEKSLINRKEFRQIIELKLPVPSKENVLQVIKKLEKIDFIESAEPNYLFDINEVNVNENENQFEKKTSSVLSAVLPSDSYSNML